MGITFLYAFNRDYLDVLNLQYKLAEFVKNNSDRQFIIFCSHPHILTFGRGEQRSVEALTHESIDRVNSIFPKISVSRGGGMTFHYPQQLVIYPIIKLSPKLSLKKILFSLLSILKDSLKELSGVCLDDNRDLVGLWFKNYKVCSGGIGSERFVSLHGVALNISYDNLMWNELSKINPCGISGSTYNSLDKIGIFVKRDDLVDEFIKRWIQLVND